MEDTEDLFNHLFAGAIRTFKSRSTFESRRNLPKIEDLLPPNRAQTERKPCSCCDPHSY
jgi:hypothetical protein